MNDFMGWKIEYIRDFGFLAKKDGRKMRADTQLEMIRLIREVENKTI